MTKSQKMKVVFCIIAVVLTVISCFVPFVWMTAQAEEGTTTVTSYTTNTYYMTCIGKGSSFSSYLNALTFNFTQGIGTIGINFIGNSPDRQNTTSGTRFFAFYPDKSNVTESQPNSTSPFSLTSVVTGSNFVGITTPVTILPAESFYNATVRDNLPFRFSYLTVSIVAPYGSLSFKAKGSLLESSSYTGVLQFEFGFEIVSDNPDSYSDPVVTICIPTSYLPPVKSSTFKPSTGTFNEGYYSGYSVGYKEGKDYEFSHVNQNSASYILGKNKGYYEGVNDSGQFSFFSLISSVVDVPIKAFVGLLDFNLFGIDMSSLYLSLFTLCIIIAIVKMLL